jgi:hypothetical protein
MKRREFVRSALLAAATLHTLKLVPVWARSGPIPDLTAVTADGREVTLRSAEIRELADALKGQLLLAGDAGYDEARLLLNPSFDKHPALVAQPSDVSGVQAAVNFAREHNLLLAVKCGGHSFAGVSSCERGLQIDLKNLRGVLVDARTRRAAVKGGTLLGQVDQATMAQGLVTPLGTVSHTGVGGLTLGGGFGRVARRFGMAIDNLSSIDVVTADGQLRHSSLNENPDLFWALRGGGGNFGVVTNFEFMLHPMQREVVAGKVTFPIDRARDVLALFAQYAPSAPNELYLDPSLTLPPGGAPGVAQFDVCYSGSAQSADSALAPIRKLGTPLSDTIKAMDYVEVQRSGDWTDARMLGMYLKGGFIGSVPEKLIAAAVEGLHADPNRVTALFFQHCGGACSRVPENATAFAHRYALANMMTLSGWPHGKEDPGRHIADTRRYWSTLESFTKGFYVNDMPREATARDVGSNYRGNQTKLVALKTKYDPTNLFRLNANIEPARA